MDVEDRTRALKAGQMEWAATEAMTVVTREGVLRAADALVGARAVQTEAAERVAVVRAMERVVAVKGAAQAVRVKAAATEAAKTGASTGGEEVNEAAAEAGAGVVSEAAEV